ncbi:MAG: cache domain-containing protein [Deltaproteobacteria bacterium]|nr:cache domain-containing protein [Deltaproteobacteria bacterium]
MRPRELVDISLDTRSRRQRLRRRFIRVVIPVGCLVLMIASIAFILLYAYHNNREDALLLTDKLLVTLDRQIAAEVENYLTPASDMVKLATSIVKDPSFAINSRTQIEPLAIQILNNYPQLTIFSIADVEGNFIMPKKMADGRIDTKIINRTGDTREVKWVRRDLSGDVMAEQIVTDDFYDARTRPWYTGAVEARGLFWTDVYIFYTDQKPGITAAMPVIDDDGRLQGVLGTDIQIVELSHFLRNLSIGRNGRALIIDQQGRLVAYPQAGRMLKRVGDTLQALTLDELDDSVLSRAYNRFKLEGHGHRVLTVDNQRYLNSVSAIPTAIVRGWSIMIVVPEDDFIGFVKENIAESLLMATLIMVLASILAGLMVFQGFRADRNVRDILNRKQEVEAQSRVFSTLASDTAVFDSTDTESLRHLTEIVSDAAAVRRASFWQIDSDGTRLVCLDCYDSESKGHTRGTQFELKEYPQLFDYLQKKEAIVISDTTEETQFSELHRVYLQPMGCRALLAVPVICRDQAEGALWFEHEGKARPWGLEDISFAKAIAGLLALRLSAHHRQEPPLMVEDETTGSGGQVDHQDKIRDQADSSVEIEPTVSPERVFSPSGIDPEPIAVRSDSRANLLTDRGFDDNGLEADVYPDATVLVLRFIDPLSLAKTVEADHSRSAIDSLVCHFEEMVAARDLDYWNIVNDQIVCAAGLGEGSTDHSRLIADTALSLQDRCTHLFADLDKRMAFRIGIDRGAVIGSQLGRERSSYNIWGDAVGAALKMADTGLTGGIHVSESAYRKLRERFVFKVRGSYYLKNIGEISTYLLTGRL